MKRTSDKLATFLGKKLNQAATVLDKTQSRPPRPPSPTSQPVPKELPQQPQQGQPQQGQPQQGQPQQGHPLYPSSEQGWFDTVDTTTYEAYHTPSYTNSITSTPTPPHPVSNVSLPSPYPPNSSNRGLKSGYLYDTSVSLTSSLSGSSAYTTQSPSPYVLPPTASSSQTSIPPPPPISSKLAQFPPTQPEPHTNTPPPPLTSSHTLPNNHNPRDPIPANLFQTIAIRAKQAAHTYPNVVLPMSRILDPSNEPDLQLWYHQLQTSPTKAIIPTPTTTITDTPTFALSLTTSDKPFSDQQWTRLKFILKALSSHTNRIRLILPSQPHTRLLPPAIYPTLSLSTRDTETSKESKTNFWPFLEEVAALWGAGLIFAAQTRGSNIAGFRQLLSYVCRRQLPVVETVKLCLRNVYFGAVDKHEAYSQQVMEIAKWAPNGICLGEHWREVLVKNRDSEASLLPPSDVYLDASRTDDCNAWRHHVGFVKKCFFLSTDRGKYYLVNRADAVGGIWVLLGVDAGNVAWSKVMSGACVLGLDTCQWSCVERAVGGQIGPVRVLHLRECDIAEIG